MMLRFIAIALMAGLLAQNSSLTAYAAESAAIPKVWQGLAARLIKDGFPAKQIHNIFSSPGLKFDARVMPRKLTHKEKKVDYEKFLKPSRLAHAQEFLIEHQKILELPEKKYNVPRELLAAIMLVETDMGRFLGSGLALNILASMAVAKDFDLVKEYLPPGYYQDEKEEKLRRLTAKKAKWAYNELKALITYCTLNQVDIFTVPASIFGAIGLCQFMPSNALRFGIDGDNDGKVHLFKMEDALMSMAAYLVHYGWKNDIDLKEKKRVLLRYNYSMPYAETVLAVMERLKKWRTMQQKG